MSDAAKAIFLSYASQDADAARRICEALRAAGLEVWFDQSELRGGDAWDASIRKQIKECSLFVPIISASTDARPEGYFRLEWKLAVDRSHLMADDQPFFVPVILGDTPEPSARVPEKFRERQWTGLSDDASIAAFAERVGKLVGGSGSPAKNASDAAPNGDTAHSVGRAKPRVPTNQSSHTRGHATPALSPLPPYVSAPNAVATTAMARLWKLPVMALAMAGIVMASVYLVPKWRAAANTTTTEAIRSSNEEAQRLTQQALAILTGPAALSAQLDAASGLMDRAVALDPSSADVLGVASQVDLRYVGRYVRVDERVDKARSRANQAIAIDPKGYEPRLAQALFLVHAGGSQMATKAEPELVALKAARPTDFRPHGALMALRRDGGRYEETIALVDEGLRQYPHKAADLLATKGWILTRLWRFDESETAMDQSIAIRPDASNLALKMFLQMAWHGDLEAATQTARLMPADGQLDDVGLVPMLMLHHWRREPEKMIAALTPVTRDWLIWGYYAPKTAITGEAFAIMGRNDAARAEWQRAMKVVEERLAFDPNRRTTIELKAYFQKGLGDTAAAAQTWKHAASIPLSGFRVYRFETIHRVGTAEDILAELEARAGVTQPPGPQEPMKTFISAADLRLNPAWDGVRNLPRFKALQTKLEKDPRFAPSRAQEPASKQ